MMIPDHKTEEHKDRTRQRMDWDYDMCPHPSIINWESCDSHVYDWARSQTPWIKVKGIAWTPF